jgi:hypothetical protein
MRNYLNKRVLITIAVTITLITGIAAFIKYSNTERPPQNVVDSFVQANIACADYDDSLQYIYVNPERAEQIEQACDKRNAIEKQLLDLGYCTTERQADPSWHKCLE